MPKIYTFNSRRRTICITNRIYTLSPGPFCPNISLMQLSYIDILTMLYLQHLLCYGVSPTHMIDSNYFVDNPFAVRIRPAWTRHDGPRCLLNFTIQIIFTNAIVYLNYFLVLFHAICVCRAVCEIIYRLVCLFRI